MGGDGFLGMTGAALRYPLGRTGLIHIAVLSSLSLANIWASTLILFLMYAGFMTAYFFAMIRIGAQGGSRFPGLEDLGDLQELLVSFARYVAACFIASCPLLLALIFVPVGPIVLLGTVISAIMLPAMLATAAMTSGCLAGMNPLPALSLIRAYPLQYLLVLVVFAAASGVHAGLNHASSAPLGGSALTLMGALLTPISLYVSIVTMRVLGGFVYYAEHGANAD